ncbi:MAG: sugar phosphate nucleotidyltransferase, partial [Candidatus Nealsonbacteria bacterium]
ASQMNVSEIVIVVGYQAEEIIKIVGNNYKNKPIKYVFQLEQKGLVHAIECAKEAIGNEDFFLFLGDEMMVNPKHSEMVGFLGKERPFIACGMIKVKDPSLISKTYAIKEKDGKIIDLIEKPDPTLIQKRSLNPEAMGTGNCFFGNEIFSYIEKTPINSKRGEKELPDLINTAVKDGKTAKAYFICDEYCNLNLKEEIKNAESFFTHFSEENHTS